MFEVQLPWGMWSGGGPHVLRLSESISCEVFAPAEAAAFSGAEIDAALSAPLDAAPLEEIARGKRTCAIAVDDLARPTKAFEILPLVTRRLRLAGISDKEIRVVVAVGSHAPLSPAELARKLGEEACARHPIENHDCRGDLAATGVPYGDRPLRINRTFLEADVRITLGAVLPHAFAGFSGGAKMVLPGLADLDAIARSHKFVLLGFRGGGDVNANRFRGEAEEIVRKLGVHFSINVVVNGQGETAGVFAGDLVSAHRHAAKLAAKIAKTPIAGTFDAAIINAWPKDVDLVQAENAFDALRTAKRPLVREGGVVILTVAAPCGVGTHGLFAPGGRTYQPPGPRRALAGRELWIYSPGVSEASARSLHWEGYPFFSSAVALEGALAARFPASARLAVFPCAAMQQIFVTDAALAEAAP